MNRELDKIVDECLTMMQAEGWSVEQCLDAYPDQSEVLRPLLILGDELHGWLSPDPPGEQFALNSKIRIQNRMRSRLARKIPPETIHQRPGTRWFLRPAYAIASAVLVIVLLSSSVGVVSASAASLPGDALYGIKLARERVALTISLTDEGDQELLTEHAETRLEEAESLIDQNRFEDLPAALQGFERTLEELEELNNEGADPQAGSLEHLRLRLENHIEVLQRVMENAPEPAREALEHALERSSHSREVLENVRGEGHPSENAPGQNKPESDRLDKDRQNPPGENGQGRGPLPKDEKETGPPPWANNE
ncbi:MAG: DUF5667 domain-containing protein [Anaerolineales bacterium]|nr:DUF5667 domain-containing protein [Anaerolineales bacterium]